LRAVFVAVPILSVARFSCDGPVLSRLCLSAGHNIDHRRSGVGAELRPLVLLPCDRSSQETAPGIRRDILRLKLNSGHFVDQIFAEIYFALRNLLAFNLRNSIEVAHLIRNIHEVHH
jgi:hypothetical protein